MKGSSIFKFVLIAIGIATLLTFNLTLPRQINAAQQEFEDRIKPLSAILQTGKDLSQTIPLSIELFLPKNTNSKDAAPLVISSTKQQYPQLIRLLELLSEAGIVEQVSSSDKNGFSPSSHPTQFTVTIIIDKSKFYGSFYPGALTENPPLRNFLLLAQEYKN